MLPASRSGARLAVVVGTAAVSLGVLLWCDTGGLVPPPETGPSQAPVEVREPEGATSPVGRPASGGRVAAAHVQGPFALAGMVQNRLMAPLADVLVLFDGVARDYEVRTGAQGGFTVADILPGSYQVVAVGPQLLTHSEFVEVTVDMAPLRFTVDQGAMVTGQVVDELRRPVVGASVTPWRRGPSGEELDPRCATRTGARGFFALRGAATDDTFVLVEHVGFAPAKSRLNPMRAAVVQLQDVTK